MSNLSFPMLARAQTLAELRSYIAGLSGLSATRRRDLLSAISRTARLIGREPADIAANVGELRIALRKIGPKPKSLTHKSLANIRANLATALKLARIIPRDPPPVPATEAWTRFLGQAPAQHQAWGLARFSRYCTARRVDPGDVTDATLGSYRHYLDARMLENDPALVCKETAYSFNKIVRSVKLNLVPLTVPTASRFRARSLECYPASLRKDIEAYKARLAHADLFDDDGPAKPLKPVSISNSEAHLRQFLDAAVRSGCAPEQFTSLADVVRPEVARAAFTVLAPDAQTKIPPGLQNMAGTILAIARHHAKMALEDIASLARIKARLFVEQKGMSAKNIQRLDQFEDWRARADLVTLPERLMKRAKANASSPRSAIAAMHAVAVAILFACPMRIKNLAGLDVVRNLRITSGTGAHREYAVRIESSQVKNGTPIDVELGKETSAILRSYLDHFRRQVSPEPGTALFPRKDGRGSRSPANFGQHLQAAILRETGLTVHPHLFRHLAAKLFLEAHPGDYETARRLLGHKKLDTTLSFYAAFDNREAHRRYQDAVLTAPARRKRK
jgi:integrase